MVLNRGAATALLEGRLQEALDMFEEDPEARPLGWFMLDRALIESRQGQHRAAIATLEGVLDSGQANRFLLHWSLAGEYEAVGDIAESQRHRALYLREYDTALEAALAFN